MKRTALIVLGMHRSGTSAIAGMLAHLGATPPKTLMPATADNPAGYWESQPIVDLNDRLLRAAGSNWSDWRALPADWRQRIEIEAVDEIADLLAAEFGDAPLFVLKDPRICRLAPLYAAALERIDADLRVILVVRDPLEVAQSLHARDGIGLANGQLLWLRYMLNAESATRAAKRVLIRYEDVLDDWRAVQERIGRDLGVQWAQRRDTEIDHFLDPSLRHHASLGTRKPTQCAIDVWASSVYEALCAMSAGRYTRVEAKLDEIATQFDHASAALGPAIDEARSESRFFQVTKLPVPPELVVGFSVDVTPAAAGAGGYQLVGWLIPNSSYRTASVKAYRNGVLFETTTADLSRPDVADVYPQHLAAIKSGFWFQGIAQRLPAEIALTIVVELSGPDGAILEHAIATVHGH